MKKRFILYFRIMATKTRVFANMSRGEVMAKDIKEAERLFFPNGNDDDRYFIKEA